MIVRRNLYISVVFSSVVAVVLLAILFETQISPLVQDLERRELVEDIHRVEQMVGQDLDHIEGIATDWGFWDDTYQFVLDRNADYRQTNMVEFWLDQYQIEALVIRSNSGKWIESIVRKDSPLSDADYDAARRYATADAQSGLVVLGNDIYLSGMVKVKGSDGSKPEAGVVILLKRIDDLWFTQLSKRFGANIGNGGLRISKSKSEPRVIFISSDQVKVSTGVRLINEPDQELVLEMTALRDLYKTLVKKLAFIGGSAMLILGIFILLLLLMLEKSLLRPINKIRNRVLEIAGEDIIARVSTRADWNERNELKSLEVIAEEARQIISHQHRILSKQRDFFERQSKMDPLTHLLNRRGLDSAFKSLKGQGDYLFCAILDIDYFKSINDTYGHDTGDLVTESFAKLLRKYLGDEMTLARTGGDEFCCVGIVDQLDSITQRFLALRNALKAELGEMVGIPMQLTCSVGSVMVHKKCLYALGELMRVADLALYEVKVNRDNWVNYRLREEDDCDLLPKTTEELMKSLEAERLTRLEAYNTK